MESNKNKNGKALAEALSDRAKHSTTFRTMAELFASRKRTRQTIILSSLAAALKKAGHKFNKPQFRSELTFLATLGLGIPILDRKNQISGLRSIRIKLQSIGNTALGNGHDFKMAKQIAKFSDLPAVSPVLYAPNGRAFDKASMTVTLEGRTFVFDFKPAVSIQVIFKLIAEMSGDGNGELKWTAVHQKP